MSKLHFEFSLIPKLFIYILPLLCLFFTVKTTAFASENTSLLTEPFLQLPEDTSVHVVWFTEFESKKNQVLLYENGTEFPTRTIDAQSSTLSRIRGGRTSDICDNPSIWRTIWRHEAIVTRLPLFHGNTNEKIPYSVVSDNIESKIYTLQAKAQPGTSMKILLTSDLQIKDMCAANIQKVYETVGQIDAILANGDIIDVADRAYDWFDAPNAFFRIMQGRGHDLIHGNLYSGAALIQNAPFYASIGNHEVMGRFSTTSPLAAQFNDPATREYAAKLYENRNNDIDSQNDISADEKEFFLQDHSFNTITWEEILTLPKNESGNERYYAVTIGDMRVIVLEVARIWRSAAVGDKGKYSEYPGASLNQYGFGQHIFEPIDAGSPQLEFLEKELQSPEFQNAKYKMVMYHWQFHSLGGNQIPAYTDPVASSVTDPVTGKEMTIYDYPLAEDYLAKYVEPLLEDAGVDIVYNAHSHIWNRFRTQHGMNIIETSNIGNTYNAFYDTKERTDAWPSALNTADIRHSLAPNWNQENFILQGDPYGLLPITPAVSFLPGRTAYLASNTITAFSILNTSTGMIDSYYFDTQNPDSEVIHFDSFPIQRQKPNFKVRHSGIQP